jgi:hypothetical protein
MPLVDVPLFVPVIEPTRSPTDEKESRGYLQNPFRNVVRGHAELFQVVAGLISHRVHRLQDLSFQELRFVDGVEKPSRILLVIFNALRLVVCSKCGIERFYRRNLSIHWS